MRRRKVVIAAAAAFAIGAAFAAQPTSLRADWGERSSRQGSPWVPGTNALMSTHEWTMAGPAPPR